MENINEKSNNLQDNYIQKKIVETKKLKGTLQLLKEAFSLYCSKFKTLLAIMILPTVLFLLLQGAGFLSLTSQVLSQSFLFSIFKILLWLVNLYFAVVAILAVIYSIKDDSGTVVSYSKAIRNSLSYIFVIVLTMLIPLAGYLVIFIPGVLMNFYFKWTAFFLDFPALIIWLFGIPAIALSVVLYIYFILSAYVFAFEEKKNFEAIWKSKKLISGNFWKIFWRLLVLVFSIGLVFMLPLGIIEIALMDKYAILTEIVKMFVVPFTIIFGILIYKNISDIKININYEKPVKLGRIIYYIAGIIALPVILVGLWTQIINLSAYDIADPDDSNLQLSKVDIPKDENAFYVFSEVEEKIYWPTEQEEKINNILSGKDWDSVLVEEILQKNKQNLSSFERGINLDLYQQPELQNPEDYDASMIISNINHLRNLARLSSIKALSLFKQGKETEAFSQSLKTIKMAQMVQDSPRSSSLTYLIGLSAKETGLSNMRLLVKDSRLLSSDLLSYKDELYDYKESRIALQKAIKSEYVMAINSKEKMIDSIFRGEAALEENELLKDIPNVLTKSNYYYQPNKTKLLFIETYGRLVANAGANNYSEIKPTEKMDINWTIVFTNNAAGRIISNIIDVSLDSLYKKRFEENYSVKGTQLLLALQSFKQDNGDLPNSLNDLVPGYIQELVQDPFSGEIIKYSRGKRVIYSVGENLVDDNGLGNDKNWRNGEDLVFNLDF